MIFGAGAILALLGAAVMITGWEYAPYIYCVGALLIAYVQLTNGYKGDNVTIKGIRCGIVIAYRLVHVYHAA